MWLLTRISHSQAWNAESASRTLPGFDLTPRLTELSATRGSLCSGKPEMASVLRQLTAVLLVWVSLLGTTTAALACDTPKADCCPPNSRTPCNDPRPSFQLIAPATCCAVAPVQSRNLAVESERSARERDQSSGSPDLVAIAAWVALGPEASTNSIADPPAAAAPRTDGTLTYLRTARLRL